MVKVHGLECVHALREEFNYKGLIIGVTGNTTAKDLLLFQASGTDAIFIKPIAVQDLMKKFKSLALYITEN